MILLWVVFTAFSALPLVPSQVFEEYAYSEQDEYYNSYSDYSTESSEDTTLDRRRRFEHQYLTTAQFDFDDEDSNSVKSVISKKIKQPKTTNLVRHPRRPKPEDVIFIDMTYTTDNVKPFEKQSQVLDIPRSTIPSSKWTIPKIRNTKMPTIPLRYIFGNLSTFHHTPSRSILKHSTATRTMSLEQEKLGKEFKALTSFSKSFHNSNESLTVEPNYMRFTQLRPTEEWEQEYEYVTAPVDGKKYFLLNIPRPDMPKRSSTKPRHGKFKIYATTARQHSSRSRVNKLKALRETLYTTTPYTGTQEPMRLKMYRFDTTTENNDMTETVEPVFHHEEIAVTVALTTPKFRPLIAGDSVVYNEIEHDDVKVENNDQSGTDKGISIDSEINDGDNKYGEDKIFQKEDVDDVQDYLAKTETAWLYTLPGENVLRTNANPPPEMGASKESAPKVASEESASKEASVESVSKEASVESASKEVSVESVSKEASVESASKEVSKESAYNEASVESASKEASVESAPKEASKQSAAPKETSKESASKEASEASTSKVASKANTPKVVDTTFGKTTAKDNKKNGTTASAAKASQAKGSVASSVVAVKVTAKTTTKPKPVTKKTTKSPQFDVDVFLEILSNLTYDYDTNLTQQMNLTLHRLNFPTCGRPKFWKAWMGWPNATIEPTTTTTTENFYYEQPKTLNNSVIAKCFVCGLKEKGIPFNTNCADAFAGDFLPLVPISPTARSKASSYRKYCRYGEFYNYLENATRPKSIWGRWTGGCSVRWTDLTGLYTQRSCRNRRRAVTGESFASKRMAKLEMALSHLDDGCIITPTATLLPLSRGISLYSRFHACVCTGNWCNRAVRILPSVMIIIPVFWLYRNLDTLPILLV